MTIQTYPKNFANLNVPEPPRGAILVNLADVEKLLDKYREKHSRCSVVDRADLKYDSRCDACKEYDELKKGPAPLKD